MEKIIAIIALILFVWYAAPYVKRGEWFAPTAIAPNTWMEDAAAPEYRELLAQPSEGYGIYRFDFWNTPPATGRPIQGLKRER